MGKDLRLSYLQVPTIINRQDHTYNTYYKMHNIGYQGVTAADGIFMEFSGSYAESNNELNILVESNLVQ